MRKFRKGFYQSLIRIVNPIEVLRLSGLIFLIALQISTVSGQETPLITDYFDQYKKGKSFYEENLFGPAKQELEKYLDQEFIPTTEKQSRYILEAEQMIVLSSLFLDLPDGEKQVREFIKTNKPDPIIIEPVLALSNYYYNRKKYGEVIAYYNLINSDELGSVKRAEVHFKKGYSHFVQREFSEAIKLFARSKNTNGNYYLPSNYYYGMAKYYLGDYATAIRSFETAGKSTPYDKLVPYYITQIHFAQDQYEELFQYGEQAINNPNIQKYKEIRLLLGRAYFEKQLYVKALPHLEYYEQNTSKLTREEFFQLGFSQYQLKKYPDAISSLQEISLLNSQLGQLVNYYLADCFIQTNDLNSARTSFKKVAQMPYEPKMQEESIFNYGKISAQLNFDREAINTLIKLEENSPYFSEARKIVNDLLVNSGDYVNSIAIIESLDNLSPELRETYQLISFNRGKQVLYERKLDGANYFFDKAKKYPVDPVINAQIEFWEGYILHEKGSYAASNVQILNFLKKKDLLVHMPIEASAASAKYIVGYNYLKEKNYRRGASYFAQAAEYFEKNSASIINRRYLNQILPDAVLRAGDCYFKINDYKNALPFYQKASDSSPNYAAYALYQKGLINGLTGANYEKIVTLEKLYNQYPNNLLADDALFQIGETHIILNQSVAAAKAFLEITEEFTSRSNLVNSAFNKLGLIAYNNGDINQALSYYKKVFENQPTPAEAKTALIAIEEIYINDKGDSEGYISFVENLPGYEVSDFTKDSLNYQIAESYYENGKYELATESFANYLKRYPNGFYRNTAQYLKAESHSILKNYEQALQDYLVLTNEGMHDYYLPSVKKSAIISYNFKEDYVQAYNLYSEWAEFAIDESDKYEAQVGAMRSSYRIGEFDNTLKYASKVIENSVASSGDQQQAYYFIGKASLEQGKETQALQAFAKIADGKNNISAEANYLIAKIYFNQDKIEFAEKQINYVTENNTNYPYWIAKSIILYADIYLKKNDLFNARAALEAIIENFKDDQNIISEANEKLKVVEQKERKASRIKTIDSNSLELDTISGNE